jgi:hypothetical protein
MGSRTRAIAGGGNNDNPLAHSVSDGRRHHLRGGLIAEAAANHPNATPHRIQNTPRNIIVFAISIRAKGSHNQDRASWRNARYRRCTLLSSNKACHSGPVAIFIYGKRVRIPAIPRTNKCGLMSKIIPYHIVYEAIPIVIYAVDVAWI